MAERPLPTGTPSLLRAINARTILELIQRTGPVSRAQVARDKRPVQADRVAGPGGAAGGRAGARGGPLQRAPRPQRRALRAEPRRRLGRRHRRGPPPGPAALADITGQIVARRDERARASSARTLTSQIGAIARGLADDAGIGWDQVIHTTVGTPGVYEPTRGARHLAPNLPGWSRQGLVEKLLDELGGRVGVENDVNLAAVGERWQGLGRGVRDFGFLSVGTGVGMGLVLGGELYRGSRGAAGEVGYLPLALDPHDPQVRRRGAFEEVANAAGVVRTARRSRHDQSAHPPEDLRRRRRGDRAAREVVDTERDARPSAWPRSWPWSTWSS